MRPSTDTNRKATGTVYLPHLGSAALTAVAFTIQCLIVAVAAGAQIKRDAGPESFGDDLHYAYVDPFPLRFVSAIPPPLAGECPWITDSLDEFIAANPADGTGPSMEGWSYTWAGVAAEAKVEAGITVLAYYPWVVTAPTIVDAAKNEYKGGPPNEKGGAVINLMYTPPPGPLTIKNLHWIQSYAGTRRGNPFGPFLDNDPDHPYTGQATDSPFYDTHYPSAGTLPGGGGYFADRPEVREAEYELDPVVVSQFQVILVDDLATKDAKGVTQNALTLYGGLWWGFTYRATDVPEPSAFAVFLVGLLGLWVVRFRRKTAWQHTVNRGCGKMLNLHKPLVLLIIAVLCTAGTAKQAKADDTIWQMTGNQPGTMQYFSAHYRGGAFLQATPLADAQGNSLIRVPNNEDVDIYIIGRIRKGTTKLVLGLVLADGGSLQYEPFTVPSFLPSSPTDNPLAVIDLAAFLGRTNPFTEGEQVLVMNGMAAQSSAITFLDSSSLSQSDYPLLFDSSFRNTLPLFSGVVQVGPSDSATAVPEPSIIAVFSVGTVCLLGHTWRRRKISGRSAVERRGVGDHHA